MSKKIYIVHGWTYSLDKWTELCKLLKEKGFEPILLKVPGLTTESDKAWSIEEYVQWLRTELKDEPSPIVVGHSNGGRISLAYINSFPDHIRKLVLIDSAGIPHESSVPKAKLRILRIISKLGKPLSYIPLVKKVFYRLIGAQDYFNAPPNMKITMRNMLDADKTLDLAKVKLPVTLIWGSDDRSTPLADGKRMKQRIAGSSLHIIAGAQHSPHGTHPEEVAEVIAEALQG